MQGGGKKEKSLGVEEGEEDVAEGGQQLGWRRWIGRRLWNWAARFLP